MRNQNLNWLALVAVIGLTGCPEFDSRGFHPDSGGQNDVDMVGAPDLAENDLLPAVDGSVATDMLVELSDLVVLADLDTPDLLEVVDLAKETPWIEVVGRARELRCTMYDGARLSLGGTMLVAAGATVRFTDPNLGYVACELAAGADAELSDFGCKSSMQMGEYASMAFVAPGAPLVACKL